MSYNVKVHELKSRPGRKLRPWRLRWSVDGAVSERNYATKALADNARAELLKAMRNGESFDPETGLPESQLRALTRVMSTPPES